MFAVDVTGFSRRGSAVHPDLRDALYRIVPDAFAATGIPFDECHHEDRGDGILVIPSGVVSVERLLGPLVTHLHARLRHHNRLSARAGQLRLRTAVNAGYVHADDHGAAGQALIHLHRLLNAPDFKATLDGHHADLGLITSHHLYHEVIVASRVIDHLSFFPITIAVKETLAPAWVWLPPLVPYRPMLPNPWEESDGSTSPGPPNPGAHEPSRTAHPKARPPFHRHRGQPHRY